MMLVRASWSGTADGANTLQPESQEITREIVLRLPERCQQIFRILGLFYFAAANDFIASARFLYAHSADGFNAMARSK